MFCPSCEKEVRFYSVSRGACSSQDLQDLRDAAAKQGCLILFNPPPVGPYRCPRCRKILCEKPSSTKDKM